MSAQELRSLYTRSFRAFPRNSRAKALSILWLTLAQLGGSVAAAMAAVIIIDDAWGYAIAGLLAIYTGTRLRALNNIVHECSHNTLVATRDDNRLIGRVCGAVLLGSFEAYREEHLTHHMHLGDYDHDLDLQGIQKLRLHDPLTPMTILRHVVTPLVGRHLPCYLSIDLSARDGRPTQIAKVALLSAALVSLALFPLATLVAVIIPRVFVYTAMNYWTDCLDHAGLLEHHDELTASRNILAPPLLRRLFFPRNDCFHLVHHLFPQVPSEHLEACHSTLMQTQSYAYCANATGPIQRAPVMGGAVLATR